MIRLTWRPQANQDRIDAIDYIAAEDPFAAIDQLDRIEQQVDTLLDHPRLGRPGRVPGTRELVISRTPFIVVYHLPSPRHVDILRLLHGSQLWPPVTRTSRKRAAGR